MNLNWLHGPAWVDMPGMIFLRPMTLEKTTVTRLPSLLSDVDEFNFTIPDPTDLMGVTRKTVTREWVLDATTFELRGLRVEAPNLIVELGQEAPPAVHYLDADLRARAVEVAELLTTNGRPRLQVRRRLMPLVPGVGVVAGVAAYLWWLFADKPGWPLGVLVGLLVVAAGVSLLDLGWRLLPRRRPEQPNVVPARPGQLANAMFTGHLIEETRRDEWLQRRWATRRDFKVGVPAAVVGSVLTAVILALFG